MIQRDDANNQTSLIEQIWDEQIRSWKNGSIVPAESFLARHPHLLEQPDQAIDVIFNEYAILSGDPSTCVCSEDYYRRFPQLRERIEKQFELFNAINDATLPEQDTDSAITMGITSPGVPDENELGSEKDRFEFRQELGRGASSIVFEAWDKKLQRSVAIKKPHLSVDQSPRVRARLIQEARAVARLHHPGIIPIREICDSTEGVFLVSPLVEGMNLRQVTMDGLPDRAEAVRWFQEIAVALDYAHENRIIHRDVKPSNVIINRDGRAMLTDFGLALNANTQLSITQTGELIGTPAFMPPEQINSNERGDRRADVYSLGALMYFVLSQNLPFDGSFSSVIHQVVNAVPMPLRHHDPLIPRDLEIITTICLNKDPADRYQTARELNDDLRRFQNGEVIAAKATGPVERLIKFTRRKPRWVAALATLFVAIAFSCGLLLQLSNVTGERNRARAAEQTNRSLLAEASVDAGRLALQRGRLKTAATHFETALEQEFSDPTSVRLHLVECYLAMGQISAATEQLQAVIGSTDVAADDALVDYWKAELAANGVTVFGDVVDLMETAASGELDPAKKKFLEGINASTSLDALSCFREALTHDPYHHSARRMSLIMELSSAHFEELLRNVSIAQQLYPEDVDFRLIEALALAAEHQLAAAKAVINRIGMDDSTDSWSTLR